MWNLFDKDIKSGKGAKYITPNFSVDVELMDNVSNEDDIEELTEIPMVHNKTTPLNETDLCETCNATFIIMEDGFPTCSNKQCARICKDTLDYSPEWRFYGADDKNQSDPTRCGNPINPLLQESSFVCKVLTSNSSTYEMRKIRKWTEWQSMPHKEKSLYDEFQF